MANKELIIIISVIVAFAIIYIMCAAAMLCDTFNQVEIEISRARNERERRYWKKKFWITCLKLIPFGHLIVKITKIDNDHHHRH